MLAAHADDTDMLLTCKVVVDHVVNLFYKPTFKWLCMSLNSTGIKISVCQTDITHGDVGQAKAAQATLSIKNSRHHLTCSTDCLHSCCLKGQQVINTHTATTAGIHGNTHMHVVTIMAGWLADG